MSTLPFWVDPAPRQLVNVVQSNLDGTNNPRLFDLLMLLSIFLVVNHVVTVVVNSILSVVLYILLFKYSTFIYCSLILLCDPSER